jgi:hypothetical protein
MTTYRCAVCIQVLVYTISKICWEHIKSLWLKECLTVMSIFYKLLVNLQKGKAIVGWEIGQMLTLSLRVWSQPHCPNLLLECRRLDGIDTCLNREVIIGCFTCKLVVSTCQFAVVPYWCAISEKLLCGFPNYICEVSLSVSAPPAGSSCEW